MDNDPVVLAHARALLTSSPEGSCDYIDADLREPDVILDAAARFLDFTQPVALLLMGIMGHIDDEDAYSIVKLLVGALPASSYLALYDGSNVSAAFSAAQDGYNQSGAEPYYLRSPDQIAAFFDGMALVEPGLVPCNRWRPDFGPLDPRRDAETYGGAGQKTETT